MTLLNLVLVVMGTVMLAVGLSIGLLKRKIWMNGPFVSFWLGVCVGPAGFGWLPGEGNIFSPAVLEQVARLTIAAAIMEGALRLPGRYAIRNAGVLFVMLAGIMPAMWLVSTSLSFGIFHLSLTTALLLGAVITPTDPVVSSALMTGSVAEDNIPARLRNALTAESIANDSLAYPLVMLPVLCLTQAHHVGRDWILEIVLLGVIGAALVGSFLGWLSGLALNWTSSHRDTDESSIMTIGFSLTLLTLGGAKLMGSEGLLAVFTAGLVFRDTLREGLEWREERIQEAITRFFVLPVFAFFGVVAPWSAWASLGWGGVLLAGSVLILRRLPAVLIVHRWTSFLKGWRDAALAGWFGPIGVAALYYAALARRVTGDERIWTAATLVVFASLCVHSLCATPLSKRYGRPVARRAVVVVIATFLGAQFHHLL